MKKVFAREQYCVNCHLCEVYCRVNHSQSKDILKAFHSEEFLQGIFGTGAANPTFLDPAVRKVGARRRVVDKDLAELQFVEAAADYAGIMAE